MPQQVYTESSQAILETVENKGFTLIATTLSRWHRDGLLPKPQTEWLREGHGTRSVYPVGTAKQVLALLKLRQQYRNLDEVGFRLWIAGYNVGEQYSIQYLRRAGEKCDNILESLRAFRDRLDSDDEDISDEAAKQLEKITTANISVNFVRKLRKRTSRKNFDAGTLIIVDIAIGRFRKFEGDGHEQIMRSMMGLKKIDVRILDGLLKWLKDSVEGPLIDLSALLSTTSFSDQLIGQTETSFEETKTEFRQLFFGLSEFAEKISDATKIRLPGFYQIHEVMRYAKAFDLALMFLVWHRMRECSWASNYREVLNALRSVGIEGRLGI